MGTGRFALQSVPGGGWTLVRPDGVPTFVLALNHLANPYYVSEIQGAAGLAPCRSFDTLCKQRYQHTHTHIPSLSLFPLPLSLSSATITATATVAVTVTVTVSLFTVTGR